MTIEVSNRFVRSAAPAVTRRGLLKAGLGAAGAGTLLLPGTGAYALAEAADDLAITDYRLTPPGWRNGHKLTITVIADLHAGGPNMGLARVRQVVDAGNRLGSDLVVVLGDYFATHRFVTEHVPPPAWAAELRRLDAPLGTYAIFGNHDWWHDIEGTRRALADVGIPAMENDAVLLGPPGRRFWLAGLGDQLAIWLGHGRFRGVDDLPGTLAQVHTDDPVILLVHEPDIFVQVPDRVSLTLAGHTHGGQIRLPLVPPFWVPSQYGARFAYGHIVERGRHMIVSGGLGCSKVPMRLDMPPEIVRVTLGA
ncbi:MAG TPA: metallophosphoesterase [Pseudolabrys sp.]|jgi:predicted MPP superfamily phosphohydrolase|nr:metallophosphoesterase [Pseudolabrys sp.]